MRADVLERQFARMGARVKVVGEPLGRPRIDIRRDKKGEFFDISFTGNRPVRSWRALRDGTHERVGASAQPIELEVVDVQPKDRHLLLVSRGSEKFRFLCGHDERHWFVAGVPESAPGVRNVETAKEALQPPLVREALVGERRKRKFKRRNQAGLRQGEWFFVPVPGLHVPEKFILKDEPLTRGAGQRHVLELAFRTDGTLVYVNGAYPGGLTQAQFDALPRDVRTSQNWQRMTRDPVLYAKGRVRHPDHATIYLSNWHRVLPNTESEAISVSHGIVAFID